MTNGTWASTVGSVFIYGIAALHFQFMRATGTGFRKVGLGLGAFIVDAGGKFIENAINDPSYIRDHQRNWKMMWEKDATGGVSAENVKIDVSGDTGLLNQLQEALKNATSLLPSSSLPNTFTGAVTSPSEVNNSELGSTFINDLIIPIINTLKPQQVDYSVDLLMDQHHLIAICLFGPNDSNGFIFVLCFFVQCCAIYL